MQEYPQYSAQGSVTGERPQNLFDRIMEEHSQESAQSSGQGGKGKRVH